MKMLVYTANQLLLLDNWKMKVRHLRAPFIKVEDRSRRFRPEYLEMNPNVVMCGTVT